MTGYNNVMHRRAHISMHAGKRRLLLHVSGSEALCTRDVDPSIHTGNTHLATSDAAHLCSGFLEGY